MSVGQTLRSVPLFAELDDQAIDRLSRVTRTKNYPKNSVIVFEDDPGDALYVVNSGQVKVVLIGEDGREVILSVLGDGSFFGEMALIDDQPRSAHVIAMEDSRLLVLHRDDFHRCLEETPRIALGLLRQLSRRLRSADDKIGGLVLLDVPGRVARLLIQLADEGDGVVISRRVTHHTLGQMIGSSRETVSRTIKDLATKGLIAVTQATIEIQDRKGLERMGGLA
ncbi:MAG: Crp/Fnr family transcriptional regulator [Gemmatimonadales bacterium]